MEDENRQKRTNANLESLSPILIVRIEKRSGTRERDREDGLQRGRERFANCAMCGGGSMCKTVAIGVD